MTEYEIQPPTLDCARTGRALKPGETYYSVLRQSSEALIREDFSADAWSGPPEDALACWRSKVPLDVGADRPKTIDVSVLTEVFDSLSEEPDAAKLNFRYILALFLIRKKVLKLVDVRYEQEREILVLRKTRTDQEYEVEDPGLTEAQLAAVQDELSHILQSPVGSDDEEQRLL